MAVSRFFFSDSQTLGASIKAIIGTEGKVGNSREAENILEGICHSSDCFPLVRISAAMVSESRHRTKSLAPAGLDADAFCVTRLWRSEVYP